MAEIRVATQEQLDEALTKLQPGQIIVCVGGGWFTVGGSATVRASGSATVRAWDSATVRAWDSATVEAWDSATVRASGSATVEAWGSATVRASGSATVEAWDSATVRASGSATVEAWDSATVRASGSATVQAWDSATVEAWDSATVRAWGSATVQAWDSATVEAWDSATVEAWDSATVRASKFVAVTVDRGRDSKAKVQGGVLIEIPALDTPELWCDYYGVEIVDGIATLFKAVDDDYSTDFARAAGLAYTPGTAPEAPDWDGGRQECGRGLHFSPRPSMARAFNPGATRYVACPVALADIRVHPKGSYPEKVKARRVAAPCYEVDLDGERLDRPPTKRARKAKAQ